MADDPSDLDPGDSYGDVPVVDDAEPEYANADHDGDVGPYLDGGDE